MWAGLRRQVERVGGVLKVVDLLCHIESKQVLILKTGTIKE